MDSSEIEKFCSITGVSKTEAEHFLEAFSGDCDEAVKAYFDSDDTVHSNNSPHVDQISQAFNDSCRQENTSTLIKSTPVNRPKVATLSTLTNKSDDESEEGQAFYVGGSETGGGGQQVLGPPRRDRNKLVPDPSQSPDVFVRDLFQAAKSKSSKQLPFSGTGYKLGDDPNSATVLESATSSGPSTKKVSEQSVVVKMWRDGFSLDSGPLRSYTDPGASEFFNAIQSGQIPQELLRSAGGSMVNVMLEDHHHEEWHAPPTPKIKAFAGTGKMLGSPIPEIASRTSEPTVITTKEPTVKVDNSQPITQLQIRLPDGSRVVLRLNNSHTVGDVRRAIIGERPDLASSSFSIVTSYPSRELTDDTQTLEDGSLLNSTLLVRLT
ncbi:unnamed protein product [Heterobilharzia americana]|nr:unnamed protein product [Heterobilharzia americana]